MSISVGDFVRGLPNNGYSITNEKMTKGVVTKVYYGVISVKVLEHTDGMTGYFYVSPDKFEVIGHQKPFNRDEVLELLRNGCKKAILDYDLSDADLSDADLRGADLSDADLSDADLRGADLRGADLRGADLRGADLRGADLSRADLRGADLRGADLRGADLRGADLSRADLRGADLRGADLRGADLRGAGLSDADLSDADIDFACWPMWCGGLRVKIDKRIACQLAYHLCSMQCDDEEYIKMRNSILGFANQFYRVNECRKLKAIEIKKGE